MFLKDVGDAYGCENNGTFNMDYSFLGDGGGSYPSNIVKSMKKKYKITWLCDCAPGYIGAKCEHEGMDYHSDYPIIRSLLNGHIRYIKIKHNFSRMVIV